MRLELYHHLDATTLNLLQQIVDLQETNMALLDDINTNIAATNVSLDNIQADIATLQAGTGGLTAAETQTVVDATAAIAAKAAQIAAIVP